MKIYCTISFLTIFSILAEAQPVQSSLHNGHPVSRTSSLPPNQSAPVTNMVSDWYNYGQTIYDMGGNVGYYRNFLFADSTVLIDYSNGMGKVYLHSEGQVFDPTSHYYGPGQAVLNAQMPYTVDSIAIPYKYFRHQHANPDTIIVQVYPHSALNVVPNPFWLTGASYANVDYSSQTRLGVNASQSFTVLLDDNDTAVSAPSFIKLGVNMNMNAGEKMAATFTYFAGNPFSPGDTIEQYMSPMPVNLRNAFEYYNFYDMDLNLDAIHYNNELRVSSDIRYNYNSLGWNGHYLPGTAFNSGFYNCDVYFKITFDADLLSVSNTSSNSFFTLYPNPSADRITLRSSEEIVRAEITDAAGRICMNETGNNLNTISVSSLSPGMYFVKLFSADGKISVANFTKSNQ